MKQVTCMGVLIAGAAMAGQIESIGDSIIKESSFCKSLVAGKYAVQGMGFKRKGE